MTEPMIAVVQERHPGTIGASDAVCALGLNPYRAPISLWRQLRGMDSTDDTEAPSEAAEMGQLLEPVVRGLYALRKPAAVYVPSASTVRDGWLHATCDGLVVLDGSPGTYDGEVPRRPDGLLEVKTASAWKRDEWEHGVPAGYEVQVRHQLAVMDLPWCDVVCLLGGQRFIGPIRIERDLNLEEAILRDLRVFWESVQTGKEPPVDASAGWRQHVSEKMRPTKVVMQADDEMRELVEFWLAQRRKRKKAQEEEDAAKNDILLRMSAAGATGVQLDAETKISAYKVGGRTDYKAYATDNLPCTSADLAKYKTEGNTWALKAPKEDE